MMTKLNYKTEVFRANWLHNIYVCCGIQIANTKDFSEAMEKLLIQNTLSKIVDVSIVDAPLY